MLQSETLFENNNDRSGGGKIVTITVCLKAKLSRFIDGKYDHFKKTDKNGGWDSVAAFLSSMYIALGLIPKVGKKEGTEEWRGGKVKGRKGGQT